MKKPKLDYGNGYNETNSIAIIWTIEDVKSIKKGSFDYKDVELTDEECMDILDGVLRHNDRMNGVCSETIKYEFDCYCAENGK